MKIIELKWDTEDIMFRASARDIELTEEQADSILLSVKLGHDASVGVNWEVIDCHIDMYLEDNKPPTVSYSTFLFCQLFMLYVGQNPTRYKNLEYDIIYPIVLEHEAKFKASKFNNEDMSEYDCIAKYLCFEFNDPF